MATQVAAAAERAVSYGSSLDHLRDELGRIDLLVRGQVVRARQATGDDAWRGVAISEPEVDALLARPLGQPPWDAASAPPSLADAHALADRIALAIEQRAARATVPLRLVQLAARFALDRFALDVLLVALLPEIDLRYERLYAYLHDDVTRKRPSVDLTLHLLCRLFDERFAARARFEVTAPLVHHGLVQLISDASSPPLLSRAVKIDDRVVDWLHGSDELDPRLARHARRIEPRTTLADLLIDTKTRDQLARCGSDPALPVVYLHGPPGVGKRTAAEALAHAVDRDMLALDLATLAGLADDATEVIVRAAEREARLADDLLLFEGADLLLSGERRFARAALLEIMKRSPAPIVLTGETAWDPSDTLDMLHARPFVRLPFELPDTGTRVQLWRKALTGVPLGEDVDLDRLAGRMRLGAGQIHDAAATARGLSYARSGPAAPLTMIELDEACRRHSSRRFGSFARKITSRPTWDDLVLPAERVDRLRELCDHARHRAVVLERWGFDRKLPNGKGLGLLFVGAPGTGKTLAASVIAGELGLDLYQIDLAAVVSKWIGETEKHLSQIFDEAERGHGVLFFDEADALFGKRTELHDAHDRYANLETSYLLQRIEAYEGIVILASNFRRNLDEAFVRRLRFIVEFPLPDERERRRIWEQIWPAETPRAPDLDLAYLARRFELAGAYIRNIALAAAFLAAAEHQPVGQRHVLHAAHREYQKLGKMIDKSAFGGQS
jgi:SpoVK/Ycf46/Vps4 family AAA+-type ATPase